MDLIARLRDATEPNVGYRFYDNAGIAIGARRTTGIVTLPEAGSFIVVDAAVPSNAAAVYWNDTVTLAEATEQFREAFRLDAVPTTAQIRTELSVELARIDVAVSSRNATTPPTTGAIRAELATELARIDTTISSRLEAGDYTEPLNSEIAAIKAKTDNLPALPASTTNITGGVITTVTNLTNAPTAGDLTATMKASVDTAVWGAGTRTLSSFGTLVSDMATAVWGAATRTLTAFGFTVAPTASANAAAVRVELATELARVDVAVSTRNAVAPDNAGIAAIQAKTDLAELILLAETYVPVAPPVLLIPTPDPDELLSVVYAYTESVTNETRAGIVFTFWLVASPAISERILESVRKYKAKTNAAGFMSITLQRDLAYRVVCADLALDTTFTPTTETFDLITLLP